MKKFTTSLVLPLAVAIIAAGYVFLMDAAGFHQHSGSDYGTPWFSAKWWLQPYTHLRLAFYPSTEYWTTNNVGSEQWLVREYEVDGKRFWTVLERIPVATRTAARI